jgi:hypothetical protein
VLLPHVEPIVRIHRGDGYVHFARSDDEVWQNLPAVRVSDLQSMFPEFVQQLMRDSYFGINSRWRQNDSRLTRLNACWVDIDLHGPRQVATVGQVVGRAMDMVQDGELPRPSLTVYSGRGVWFLWLLVADDGYPPKAFPEKVLAVEKINRELNGRLGGDGVCINAKRMLRVPGSTNNKADPGEEIVRFLFEVDENGRCEEYGIDQLLGYLGLQPSKSKKGQNARLTGWAALWTYRFHDFQVLRQMRGGFQEGCRNNAAHYYAVILQHLSFDDDVIREKVSELAEECRPPLQRAQVVATIREIKQTPFRKYHDSKIIKLLNITQEEAKRLSLWDETTTIAEVDEMDAKLTPNRRVEYRKQLLAKIIDENGGRMLSCRKLARILAERGIQVSHVQVNKYLKSMPRWLESFQPGLLHP